MPPMLIELYMSLNLPNSLTLGYCNFILAWKFYNIQNVIIVMFFSFCKVQQEMNETVAVELDRQKIE